MKLNQFRARVFGLMTALPMAALLVAACVAPVSPAAAPAATDAPAATAPRMPLQDAVGEMAPQAVWQNFYALTQVPRPSHHEEQVRAFLVDFGRQLGLETIVDPAGNVLIRKPAAPGLEDRPGVVLQAHMDMVPQKTPDSAHDFLVDPIQAYVDAGWVTADGTTLGADDGIGMAMAMAVLQAQTPPLGPLEALFTVNEEDGMDGALGLPPDLLQGRILINLDSETEGEFTIGSAGGEYGSVDTTYAEIVPQADGVAYAVTVGGLKGGHSGIDINRGRGHAIKLLVRFLQSAADVADVQVAQLAGGDAANAITREATAHVVIPAAAQAQFLDNVAAFEATVRAELAAVEPDLAVTAAPVDLPPAVMEPEAQRTLLDALYAMPQGVMRMSDAVPGLVETSTNTGIVAVADGDIGVTMNMRSSVDTELDDLGRMVAAVWDLADMSVAFSGRYAGWNPNPDAPIVVLMQATYADLYGQTPGIVALHAGLECGAISALVPGMDAISIGPTLHDVHTPAERLEIASVEKVYNLVLETLVRIAAQDVAAAQT